MAGHGSRPKHVYLFGGHTEHSLAPALWNYVFGKLRQNCAYVPVSTEAEALADEVLRLRHPSTIGANVTIPLKEAAASIADVTDEDVRLTGATNWLSWRRGSLCAANTDVTAARKLTIEASGQVLLLGAGGGAAAVAAGMRTNVENIVVADVDGRRAQNLRDRIASWGTECTVVKWSERRFALPSSDVVVNATPLGMSGPLADASPIEPTWLSGPIRVYDLVYAPSRTPLQHHASALGLPLVDGLAHLYEQAVDLLPHMNLTPEAVILLEEGISAAFPGRRRTDWSSASAH